MTTSTPQLALTRIVNAPRRRVYQAFTDPDDFSAWWGPTGNSLPRDGIEFDVRPGGHQQWREEFPADPGSWTLGRFDLTEVVTGELPHGFEPFETRLRIEFYDEAEGLTRLEIRQWLPESYVAPSENGWSEALAKLDHLLAS